MPERPRLYVETSVVSYLTARSSADPSRSARQEATQAWWARRNSYCLFTSQFVLDEARMGHPEAAARRIAALRDIAVLELTPLAWLLALEILGEGGLPATEYIDAAHVALAAAHGVDVLLTWNCAHMANPAARSKLALVCEARGLSLPSLVTPAELSKE